MLLSKRKERLLLADNVIIRIWSVSIISLYVLIILIVFLLFPDVTCPAGQLYQECSSSCTQTCSDVISPDSKCNEDCIEGCACPKGMVKKDEDSNVCVAKTTCGCQVGDKLIANGGRVQKGCNTWYDCLFSSIAVIVPSLIDNSFSSL